MFIDTNKFVKLLLSHIIKITVAGLFIGFLHKYDIFVACVLATKLVQKVYKEVFLGKKHLYLLGIILTLVTGISGEYFGVSNGYWAYHDVPRDFPFWLPFAWMLAFCFLYRLEEQTFLLLKNKNFTNKLFLTILLVSFFPAYGEIITIALGVWTYYWPYQILGVPLYAVSCLVFLHLFVDAILVWVNKKFNMNDDVFSL